MIGQITPTELKSRLDAGEDITLIDVRNAWELEVSQLSFAQHIVMEEIPNHLNAIPTDKPVVLMCRSGGRSMQVGMYLANQGWDNLLNLQGGILGWAQEVDPTLPTNY